MKNIKYALACWSKEIFEDIFKKLIIGEKIGRLKEDLFEENPQQAIVLFFKRLRMIEEIFAL